MSFCNVCLLALNYGIRALFILYDILSIKTGFQLMFVT